MARKPSTALIYAPPAGEADRPSAPARAAELLSEIQALRTAMSVALESYERRVSGQLAEVARALHRDRGDGGLPNKKAARAMLTAIRAAELKPARGRARDLVRVQELVAELTELMTPSRR